MTFDQLRYFLETAKFQHLGRAAKSLHISPSAVSTAIAALEEELKAKFFERDGKGIRLTENGKKFRAHAEQLLDHVAKVQQSINGADLDLTGSYRIAGSPFLTSHFLAAAWCELQGTHPKVSLELGSLPTHQVVSKVLSGDLDAGLCFSPQRFPDLKNTELYRGQMRIALRKGHPILKQPAAKRIHFLAKYPAVIHKAAHGVDVCEDHPMFDKFGIKPDIRAFWDSDEVGAEIIKKTDAWGLFPDLVLEQLQLQALQNPPGWDAPFHVAFVTRVHRAESPFLKLIMESLRKRLIGGGK